MKRFVAIFFLSLTCVFAQNQNVTVNPTTAQLKAPNPMYMGNGYSLIGNSGSTVDLRNSTVYLPSTPSTVPNVATVETIAALRGTSVSGLPNGAYIVTAGYYAAYDGGGGTYIYNSSSSATDNGGTIIQPSSGSGRWLLQVTNDVSVLQFGAYPNASNTSTTTTAFQNAFTWALANARSLHIPGGIYDITSWNLSSNSSGTSGQLLGFRIYGDGSNESIIQIISASSNSGVGIDLTGSKWLQFDSLRINGGGTAVNAPNVTILEAATNDPVKGFIFGGLCSWKDCIIVGYGDYTIYNLGFEQTSYYDCQIYNEETGTGIPVYISKANTPGITSPNQTIQSPAISMTAVSFNGWQGAIISNSLYGVYFDLGASAISSISFNDTYMQLLYVGAYGFYANGTTGSQINDISLNHVKIEQGTSTRNQQAMRIIAQYITGIRAVGVCSAGGTMTASQFIFSTNISNCYIDWNPNDAVGGYSGSPMISVSGTASSCIFKSVISLANLVSLTSSGSNYIASAGDGMTVQGTTASFSGNLTVGGTSTLSSGIVGSTTNDTAASGIVGYYTGATKSSGSAVSLSTGTPANIVSVSLPAGDWDVSGVVYFSVASGTTMTAGVAGTSTTSATLGSQGSYAIVSSTIIPGSTSGFDAGVIAPVTRYSLASTTTVYLVCDQTFSGSTVSGYGNIRVREVR